MASLGPTSTLLLPKLRDWRGSSAQWRRQNFLVRPGLTLNDFPKERPAGLAVLPASLKDLAVRFTTSGLESKSPGPGSPSVPVVLTLLQWTFAGPRTVKLLRPRRMLRRARPLG
ncbi:Tight Junction-Associated Protein 1 [Manis pentadactyla]|nr:Tight Junction-Associated Protein 1 [Manis pentadactyla]